MCIGYSVPADDDSTLNPYNFFQVYLAAPVVLCTVIGWIVYRRITTPEMGWWTPMTIADIDVLTGLGDIPSLEQLQWERKQESKKPWYERWYNILFR